MGLIYPSSRLSKPRGLTSGAVGTSFSPDTGLSGIAIWFDPATTVKDSGGNIAADEEAVQTWIDRIAIVSATQATAGNQPTYEISGSDPVVTFDGSNDYLSHAGDPYTTPGDFFIAWVINPTSFASAFNALSGTYIDGSGAISQYTQCHVQHKSSTVVEIRFGTNNDYYGRFTHQALSPGFHAFIFRIVSGTAQLWVDGTEATLYDSTIGGSNRPITLYNLGA